MTLWQRILTYALVPPVMACVFWVLASAWDFMIAGKSVDDGIRKLRKRIFWFIFILLYAMAIAALLHRLYKYFRQ
jgi:hypothetical protein